MHNRFKREPVPRDVVVEVVVVSVHLEAVEAAGVI